MLSTKDQLDVINSISLDKKEIGKKIANKEMQNFPLHILDDLVYYKNFLTHRHALENKMSGFNILEKDAEIRKIIDEKIEEWGINVRFDYEPFDFRTLDFTFNERIEFRINDDKRQLKGGMGQSVNDSIVEASKTIQRHIHKIEDKIQILYELQPALNEFKEFSFKKYIQEQRLSVQYDSVTIYHCKEAKSAAEEQRAYYLITLRSVKTNYKSTEHHIDISSDVRIIY